MAASSAPGTVLPQGWQLRFKSESPGELKPYPGPPSEILIRSDTILSDIGLVLFVFVFAINFSRRFRFAVRIEDHS